MEQAQGKKATSKDLRMYELQQKMEVEKIKAKRDLVERIAISALWVLMADKPVSVFL